MEKNHHTFLIPLQMPFSLWLKYLKVRNGLQDRFNKTFLDFKLGISEALKNHDIPEFSKIKFNKLNQDMVIRAKHGLSEKAFLESEKPDWQKLIDPSKCRGTIINGETWIDYE